MTYRTYREFEQKIRNCDTNLEIVRLCVDNNDFAKRFVERQDWLRRFQEEIDSWKELNR
jgi:hypothetical protein